MNPEVIRSILALAAAIIEKTSQPAAEQVALAENAIHIAEKAKERAGIETDETTVELLNVLVEIQLAAARSSMDTALALLNPAV